MISIEGARKDYGPTVALQPVSLDLAPGKTHVFLGSSGSGKSTLLKLITGLTPLTRGRILYKGESILQFASGEWVNKIGYVLQEGGLFPHMNLRRNICLKAEIKGWSRERQEGRLEELVELFGFEPEWLDRFPRQLSGGQQQRAAIMRALFMDPPIVLMDEPLGALDPLIRSRLQMDLRHIFRRLNKLVILVTHDLGEAAFFGDTVTLFHEGKMIQHGSFNDLLDHPATEFVSEFTQAQRTFIRKEGEQ